MVQGSTKMVEGVVVHPVYNVQTLLYTYMYMYVSKNLLAGCMYIHLLVSCITYKNALYKQEHFHKVFPRY